MYVAPLNYSLPCNKASFKTNCSNEKNKAYATYFNQSIDHYYNLENCPKPMKFWCDICVKGFYSHGKYKKHIDEHEKCPFPECKLEGSLKFIDQHITHTHMMINFEALLIDNDTWITERSKRFPKSEDSDQRSAVQMEILKKQKLRKLVKLKKEQERISKNGGKKTPKGAEDLVSKKGTNWIAERNKKFPSKQIGDLKKAQEIERSKRGERLGKATRRFPKTRTKGSNSSCKRKYKKDNEERQEFKRNIFKDEDCSEPEERYGIKPFKGITTFYESLGEIPLFGIKSDVLSNKKQEELEISDDEFDQFNNPAIEIEKQQCVLHNALGSLMDTYGSDSDIDEKELPPKEEMSKTSNDIKKANSIKATEVTTKQKLNNDKLKENASKRKRKHKKGSSKDSDESDSRLKRKKISDESDSRLKRKKISNTNVSNHYRPRTLLQNLLQPQIIHERNVLLQCIRYIVNNNFFDSEKSS